MYDKLPSQEECEEIDIESTGYTDFGGRMKTAFKFTACAIALFIVILGNSCVFAGGTPAARLEGAVVENEPPLSDQTPSSSEGQADMPQMSFAPATSTESVVGSNSAVSDGQASGHPKYSNKIREYWLRIHADEMKAVNDSGVHEQAAEAKSAGDSVASEQAVEIKAANENTPAGMEPGDVAPITDAKKGEATIKIEKPIPHSEAPVVVQTTHQNKLVIRETTTVDENVPSAVLPLFSEPLAKLNARRAYREAEARRLNVVLPSQGGTAEKVLPSMLKMNAFISGIIEQKTVHSDIKQAGTNELSATPVASKNPTQK